ncbi:Serine/threonine-protein kinase StkP [Legionella massiliensis]|uniref:non-specific serine/threonine protein kinase n=1 Tax=Legionella massiliensis TaxID=1034943 RepID=A0A078KWL7_9GAMM|nr:protein kinase [Legionella massiliensis]CDZ76103.1 Serine/threonine-protein kinase StkP [Legionella massiliensis]CEE11841.1 Serine/threonine-protein kinase StkP [Legionella massiliensis]
MKLLKVSELKSLPNMDENSLHILKAILGNKEIRKLIKSANGNPIPFELMKEKFGIDCQIIFVKSDETAELKPVVVPAENRISGGGKSFCKQYKTYGLDDGKTYFLKTIKISDESLPEALNEEETLGKTNRLIGTYFCKETEVKYLLTSFVKGIDLSKFKDMRPLSVELKHFWETCGIIISASSQMSTFHGLDLIHRDIKPGNIMLDADNQCHLVDFGSSSSDEEPKPISWGTGPYLAPEIREQGELLSFSKSTDIYALGCSFNELFEIFKSVKFAKVVIGAKNKHLVQLHTEISSCIEGMMSDSESLRMSCFSRMNQLQRTPESFKSRPEAYTYTIMLLTQWLDSYKDEAELTALNNTIQAIKVAYENHQQDTGTITALLDDLLGADWLLSPHKAVLAVLKNSYTKIDRPEPGHDDILPRRFESDFVSHCIQKPTAKTMQAIKLVSDAIIQILVEYQDSPSESIEGKAIQEFLAELVKSDILFGAPRQSISIEEIIKILSDNKPEDFVKIQHISFKFAQKALRQLALNNLPGHEPTGPFLEILKKYQAKYPSDTKETPSELYHRLAAVRDETGKGEGYRFRAFICDELFYGDEIFTTADNRGRSGSPNQALHTNQVGLMKFEHSAHTQGLLSLEEGSWYADCKTQKANPESIHYTSALNTDCPYITGPSGMTSLFMNMMFVLVNPNDSEVILSYSLGVMTYVVGAGYHSIKEILIPMVKCVDAIPGYPQLEGMDYLTTPPLYNHYFSEIEKFDGEFAEMHQNIWASHLTYFESTFMPICMRENCHPSQIFAEAKISHQVFEMCGVVSKSVELCLAKYNSDSTGSLSLFTPVKDAQSDALVLLESVCQKQLTLTSVFRQIQSYFKGSFEVGEGISIKRTMQLSFIGHFFNVLKDNPVLLSHLNLTLKIDSTIGIDCCNESGISVNLSLLQKMKSSTDAEELHVQEAPESNQLPKVFIVGY